MKTPKAWCGTHTTDIMHAIQQVKSRCPDAKIYGFGLSFGGLVDYYIQKNVLIYILLKREKNLSKHVKAYF